MSDNTSSASIKNRPAAIYKSDDLYKEYIKNISFDSNGRVNGFELSAPDDFNFAYDVVDRIAGEDPDKLALLWTNDKGDEKRITFGELKKKSDAFASMFASKGIGKGDFVIVCLKRHYNYWYSYIALHKIGAVCIPATSMLQVHDFTYRLGAADIKAAVITSDGTTAENFDAAVKECGYNPVKFISGADREGWFNVSAEADSAAAFTPPEKDKRAGGKDMMLLFFTSGTTGMPKMVTHDYFYPLGHLFTAVYWHNTHPGGLHITVADTGWAKTAWGKMYGQLFCGGAMFIYDHDRFNAHDMLQMISKHKVTTFCAPPTIYKFFLQEDLKKYDLSALRHATIAGEALNPEVFNKFKEATGLELMEGYGQTENMIICCNQFVDVPKPGSMGRPIPALEVDLLDADGKSAAAGVNGEIVVKIPRNHNCYGFYMGYYKDEALTAEVWHDGYYHTGDIAWKDEDGYYWFVGRTDDIIKSSGYRIGPFEVESVIMEHPAVFECAVIGVPDETRGQLVKAFIVAKKGYEKNDALAKEIQDYVKSHTAPYKYPRIVEFVDYLPKTISNKIRRVEMREKNK